MARGPIHCWQSGEQDVFWHVYHTGNCHIFKVRFEMVRSLGRHLLLTQDRKQPLNVFWRELLLQVSPALLHLLRIRTSLLSRERLMPLSEVASKKGDSMHDGRVK